MRLHIDPDRCEGHGRCYATAPDLFSADEIGNGQVLGDGTVTDAFEHQAHLAVANCPERAITIEDTG